jgi:hypothetical protein
MSKDPSLGNGSSHGQKYYKAGKEKISVYKLQQRLTEEYERRLVIEKVALESVALEKAENGRKHDNCPPSSNPRKLIREYVLSGIRNFFSWFLIKRGYGAI